MSSAQCQQPNARSGKLRGSKSKSRTPTNAGGYGMVERLKIRTTADRLSRGDLRHDSGSILHSRVRQIIAAPVAVGALRLAAGNRLKLARCASIAILATAMSMFPPPSDQSGRHCGGVHPVSAPIASRIMLTTASGTVAGQALGHSYPQYIVQTGPREIASCYNISPLGP